jgi:hypothetical protein
MLKQRTRKSVRLGKVTRLTLSILTHLPLPVVFDGAEILFNQTSCNFSTFKNSIVKEDDKVRLEVTTKEMEENLHQCNCRYDFHPLLSF